MAAVKKFRTACRNGTASCITAWDYPTALLCEEAQMDLILIGDSTGIVALGLDNTAEVTLDEIIYHCKAVARGAKSPFLLGDMPMGSYEKSAEHAVDSALRLVKEGHVDGVKLEGGKEMAAQVAAITRAGVPVIGHIGLTPQRALQASGDDSEAYGETAASAQQVLEDALSLQEAGAIAVVLEAVSAPASQMITEALKIPTIGIGCGATCNAQIVLQSEVLGYSKLILEKYSTTFSDPWKSVFHIADLLRWHKKFANVGQQSIDALKQYKAEVQARTFPSAEHTYDMPEKEREKLQRKT